MTATPAHVYESTYTSPYGDRFEAAADRGVQAIGHGSRQPLNATEPGPGWLTVTGTDRGSVKVALTPGVIAMIRNLLETTSDVMDSRLVENDRRPHSG
jgi:hypothetical protein